MACSLFIGSILQDDFLLCSMDTSNANSSWLIEALMSAGRIWSPLTSPTGSQRMFSMRLFGCAAADLAQLKSAMASA